MVFVRLLFGLHIKLKKINAACLMNLLDIVIQEHKSILKKYYSQPVTYSLIILKSYTHVMEGSLIDFARGNAFSTLGGGGRGYTRMFLKFWQQSIFQMEKLPKKNLSVRKNF